MTEADLALEADDDDLQATWLLGAAADHARHLFWCSRTRRRHLGWRPTAW